MCSHACGVQQSNNCARAATTQGKLPIFDDMLHGLVQQTQGAARAYTADLAGKECAAFRSPEAAAPACRGWRAQLGVNRVLWGQIGAPGQKPRDVATILATPGHSISPTTCVHHMRRCALQPVPVHPHPQQRLPTGHGTQASADADGLARRIELHACKPQQAGRSAPLPTPHP